MTARLPLRGPILLPNLGAEEGEDLAAYPSQPAVRVAAHLWALLFSGHATLFQPASGRGSETTRACATLWPADLAPASTDPVFDWLQGPQRATAWLNTAGLERWAQAQLGEPLAHAPSEVVDAVHDKAFALAAARDLELAPGPLLDQIRVLSPDECRTPDTTLPALTRALESWPDWMGERFTLKPRFGSSGRGRVAGRGSPDTPAVGGALTRLAARGGAIFEPWLERRTDLSVSLFVPPSPPPDATEAAMAPGGAVPRLLGSLEMLATPSGGYRGHCGEVDSRGRVFSGHAQDEILRGQAAQVAARARTRGFFGPCGVDAFSYMQEERLRLRGAVEFNARSTMGLVTIGLVRRALPLVRRALELTPGARRGFLLALIDRAEPDLLAALLAAASPQARAIDLTPETEAEAQADPHTRAPRPVLVFDHDREPLREAHRRILGC